MPSCLRCAIAKILPMLHAAVPCTSDLAVPRVSSHVVRLSGPRRDRYWADFGTRPTDCVVFILDMLHTFECGGKLGSDLPLPSPHHLMKMLTFLPVLRGAPAMYGNNVQFRPDA
ncbi:hypothetical protein P280DRAFT_236105 [Massarina eburnea CBS 473.64]|uniref:Secreted protein n=1 Tax=Massarina eburnea CBS 473.64 TaxID=1395130 RepID=A0A6A6RHM8_9PLEO|nr:hypothetical protein P280DRAFT_236105 [Massarina eburnea CBS 473.64]